MTLIRKLIGKNSKTNSIVWMKEENINHYPTCSLTAKAWEVAGNRAEMYAPEPYGFGAFFFMAIESSRSVDSIVGHGFLKEEFPAKFTGLTAGKRRKENE